jgi:hypothetical protein
MALATHERTERLDALYTDYCAISDSALSLVRQLKIEPDPAERRELAVRLIEHDRQRAKVLDEMESVRGQQ